MVQGLRILWTFCFVYYEYASSLAATAAPKRNILRSWILAISSSSDENDNNNDNNNNNNNGSNFVPQTTFCELALHPEEIDKPDEDELEVLYPTTRRYFCFGDEQEDDPTTTTTTTTTKEVMIRTTSFGCGKLGAQIWKSSLALCLYCGNHHLLHNDDDDENNHHLIQNQNVLELGAGCGLPSVLFRDVLGAASVIATDFWREEDEDFDKDRLVPEHWHRINLEYNVVRRGEPATVQRLDWHDPNSIKAILDKYPVDLVVGSDLIYYDMDLEPLWNTLDFLLKESGVKQVLLVSALSEAREALPEFLELIKTKGQEGHYHIEMEELIMLDTNRREEEDAQERFLKISVKRKKEL